MTEVSTITESTEIGLRCPDGSVVWPPETYADYPINTPAERNIIAQMLRQAAPQLRIHPDVFVASFQWVVRKVTTLVLVQEDSTAAMGMGTTWEVADATDGSDGEPPVQTPNE